MKPTSGSSSKWRVTAEDLLREASVLFEQKQYGKVVWRLVEVSALIAHHTNSRYSGTDCSTLEGHQIVCRKDCVFKQRRK